MVCPSGWFCSHTFKFMFFTFGVLDSILEQRFPTAYPQAEERRRADPLVICKKAFMTLSSVNLKLMKIWRTPKGFLRTPGWEPLV